MTLKKTAPDALWRGMVCLDIALTFADDRARIGLAAAVDRLRDAQACPTGLCFGARRSASVAPQPVSTLQRPFCD